MRDDVGPSRITKSMAVDPSSAKSTNAAANARSSLPLPSLRRARLHAELAGMDALHAARAVAHAQRRCKGDDGDSARFWRALYVELAPLGLMQPPRDPVANALASLPLESRTALLLRLGESMPISAIAQALDETESRAAAQLAHSVVAMRTRLSQGRSDALWLAELTAWLHAHEPASARIERAAADSAETTMPAPLWAQAPISDRAPIARGRALRWLAPAVLLATVGTVWLAADRWLGAPAAPTEVVDPLEALLALRGTDASLVASSIDLDVLAQLDFYLWLTGHTSLDDSVQTEQLPTSPPAPAPAQSLAEAGSWSALDETARAHRLQRFAEWQAFSPAKRAALRLNVAHWLAMNGDEQRSLLQLRDRYIARPAGEREALTAAFEALPPAARRALLPELQDGDLRGTAREIFSFVPLNEETRTLAMLAALDADSLQNLRQITRRMPPWQREALRTELLTQPEPARQAWLEEHLQRR